MNYYVSRDGQHYGPYTLADLQRYVASGHVQLTDLARSEGMDEWAPVSQVMGTIPVPVAAPVAPGYAGSSYSNPPDLHWGIVLGLAVVTCFVFHWVWVFVEATFVRKIVPQSKAMYYYMVAVPVLVLSIALRLSGLQEYALLARIAGGVLWIIGAFKMRSDLEEHYNSAEPIGLSLNAVMTFFFSVYYFQFHFNRINQLKRSGQLTTAQGM